MSRPIILRISDSSRVGEARREATSLAQRCGFEPNDAGSVGVVATEAAGNLVKHASQGHFILRTLEHDGCVGIEVTTVDKGPGMRDVAKCMEDGFSTAGSPGTGLGAISRMASLLEIHSSPGKGTVLVAQVWRAKNGGRPAAIPLTVGVVCAPMADGEPCGDSWSMRQDGNRTSILVVDGLGHGPLAARAADEAVRVFQKSPPRPGPEMVREMHAAMRSTRGASLAIAEIDRAEKLVRFTGVGNIGGQICMGDTSRSMVSYNGTVGHELHTVREFTYPWSETATIVMYSDGILTRWSVDDYPGILLRHPTVLAAVIFRDFSRGRDDTTVVTARGNVPVPF